MVAACACALRWNVGSSEEAAAEGESKEPKVPWRVRAEPAVALLVGRRWVCGWVVPTKRSGASAEKCANAFVRNPSPPESRKRQGRNAPIFQPCRAEPVGRAANFRANFHGAAAKLNAPQAFNAPTCHGNSRNTSFNVLPRRVPIRAEPSAVPHTRRTPHFSSLRGEKARKQPERQLQRSSPQRSNPRRTSAVPHTRRTPRFSSLRGEKARKQPERSTFSPHRSNPRRTIRRSLRLHYLTFHKRQGHAKECQLRRSSPLHLNSALRRARKAAPH